jgi:sugar/nucleoside kinase (ribokinase family)
LRIGIASHIVLDTIKASDGRVVESIGGPPCYCGLVARRFGFDVELATKVGIDFPEDRRRFLSDSKIALKDWHVAKNAPTTRFGLEMDGTSRRLVLRSKCAPVTVDDIERMSVDCWLASPVIDEVSADVLAAIKKDGGKKNFVMLDPQGYMRRVGPEGQVTLADRVDIDLAGITALKVDGEEMAALTGGLQGVDGMKALKARGVGFVLATEHRVVHLLHGDMHYWIKMRDIDAPDSTGAGDILASAFSCAWVKEKDPLWAVCFSAGALRAALETGEAGLGKIPPYSKIESSASYFYNTAGFQGV